MDSTVGMEGVGADDGFSTGAGAIEGLLMGGSGAKDGSVGFAGAGLVVRAGAGVAVLDGVTDRGVG